MFCAPPKRVAQQSSFYDRETEQRLANEIENPANPVLQKVRNRETLGPEEKETLCRYIAVMDTRIPEGKRRVRATFRRESKPLLEWFNEYLSTLAGPNASKSRSVEVLKRRVQQLCETWSENPPDGIWQSVILSRQKSSSVKAMSSMTWCFLIANLGESFVTSDNPIFIFRHLGIGHEESELTFPISSDIALFASHLQDWPDGCFIPASQVVTRQVNLRTVRQASRYVFHHCEASWVFKLANTKTKKIKVRRIGRLLRAG